MYISQDPIRLLGGYSFYSYVHDVNKNYDLFGLYSDLKPTGLGHHLFPRSIGDKLDMRDTIENIKWYPNDPIGTADLHKQMHQNLIDEGIPYHESKFEGLLEDALDGMDRAYKDFETKGYLMIDGKRYDDLTPGEAMDKVRQHINHKH